MDVVFKSLELEDLKSTIDLCNLCFEENNDYSYAEKVFLETKNYPSCVYINGIHNGKVIAHTKLTIIKTMYESMGTYAIINHLCVHPDYRRHHIASYLIKVVFKVAKDYNCNAVKLWSNNYRVAAHNCYKRNGFTLDETGFFTKEIM